MATMATPTSLLCSSFFYRPNKAITSNDSLCYRHFHRPGRALVVPTTPSRLTSPSIWKLNRGFNLKSITCLATRRKPAIGAAGGEDDDIDDNLRRVLQIVLWASVGVYVLWLFLLPYAPGDPVWAISSETVNTLVGLSLNFFFILPLMNSVGIRIMEAPVLHPMSEGLFNFVIGWTVMFSSLLFTDRKRDRYKWSLDLLWGLQMFLTNTFLIPYMAIRMSESDEDSTPSKTSPLGSAMIKGSPAVGLVGGAVCVISVVWALWGRMDGDFGTISERWDYLLNYLGSERLAYAFIWDVCFYTIFQPWLIGDNLRNIREDSVELVKYLMFVPVVGLVAYCLYLQPSEEP